MHFERLMQYIADVDGVIVECGVGAGRSLFDFSVISEAIDRPRHIFGYDTFSGIPDATAIDGEWNADVGGIWDYSQEQVRENLFTAGLDAELISRIELVEGELRCPATRPGRSRCCIWTLTSTSRTKRHWSTCTTTLLREV